MLTSFADDEALFASIMAGASGYVFKQVRSGELVRRDPGGGSWKEPPGPFGHHRRPRPAPQGEAPDEGRAAREASPQERRILALIADGRTNREVGEELQLAEKTVKNYVSSILSKLEVARRAEAAAYLARHTTTPGSVE